ncbi:hypothetical protein EH228_07500 [Erwinia endophytica]|uniref:hypothetical protein n=1 Tax=Erwinia endophytica TaxID=1563158 RepID=UPI001265EA9D|nr:hypothetical protein [Erwinia endophytica]KAB8312363.1 hypothetical protein EH228_07500 [Erwinia endophytica]
MSRLWMAVLLAGFSQLSSAATISYSALQGRWRVEGVQVDNSGIQAVVVNDPQYMGAEVTFFPRKIIWTKGTKERAIDPVMDNCTSPPTLTPADRNDPEKGYQVPDGFNVLCGKQPWGPGAVVTVPTNNTMTLYWYDGAILAMKKTG